MYSAVTNSIELVTFECSFKPFYCRIHLLPTL